ncbi:ferredoxin [Sphingomonas solaris]|uniref:Ferredoxin n=1 Tax=Alterirhizorhabdus solaris TaxID=2529389 RepID=A0A558RCK2_9SPHN|nr:ferredoxin [Sphingomonas solaris]TVV77096.1 ferredoxin [Sphingomonas solaris]
MSGKLKVVIDKAACCGYGVCAEICPDMYKLDGNGVVYVEQEFVPDGLEALAREGAEACPQSALSVVDA